MHETIIEPPRIVVRIFENEVLRVFCEPTRPDVNKILQGVFNEMFRNSILCAISRIIKSRRM
jgi:hypothetical protein